jgi:SNF2 family DNA or RNA helicase
MSRCELKRFGKLVRELKLRGLAERILIVCPANLAFQWQRELKEKFDEKFVVMKGTDIRDQFGMNQWMEQNRVITNFRNFGLRNMYSVV